MSVVKILAIRNTVCDNYRIGAIWVLSVLIPSLMWYEAQPGGMHYIITPCDLDCDLDETSLATAVRTRAITSLPPGLRTTLRLVLNPPSNPPDIDRALPTQRAVDSVSSDSGVPSFESCNKAKPKCQSIFDLCDLCDS